LLVSDCAWLIQGRSRPVPPLGHVRRPYFFCADISESIRVPLPGSLDRMHDYSARARAAAPKWVTLRDRTKHGVVSTIYFSRECGQTTDQICAMVQFVDAMWRNVSAIEKISSTADYCRCLP
jgi:hypothetical protein